MLFVNQSNVSFLLDCIILHTGDIIGCLIDLRVGTVAFSRNGANLGLDGAWCDHGNFMF